MPEDEAGWRVSVDDHEEISRLLKRIDHPPMNIPGLPPKQGLYDPGFEKDGCGIGFVVNIKGHKSHDIVRKGLQVLENLTHRGAQGCDPCTGDGAGILTALPHEFLQRVVREELGAELPAAGQFAAGIVFLPRDAAERALCKKVVAKLIAAQGQRLVGWRKVPTETKKADIGPTAQAGEPHIEQLIIAAGAGLSGDAFERQLYLIRKQASHRLRGDTSWTWREDHDDEPPAYA